MTDKSKKVLKDYTRNLLLNARATLLECKAKIKNQNTKQEIEQAFNELKDAIEIIETL